MFISAISNPEWTWDEAWKHLGEEFSVDPAELSYCFPKHKLTWTELGELLRERIAINKKIRRVDRLLKAARAQQSVSLAEKGE